MLGSRADDIRAQVDFGRVEVVVCEQWHAGQSASLRCGASALRGADEVIVTLGDMPRIGPHLIACLLAEPSRTRATYNRRPGHPVVLGAEELARLHELSGDVGARELLDGGRLIECGDLVTGADVDAPEDLYRIRSSGE